MNGKKSQSAMEYLMTYGWAILIIAVVLGVLFQLGVFSGSALTPKAAPGSCQLVRFGGQVSLEGECQGQLPQYVLQTPDTTGAAYISSPTMLPTGSVVTITAWFNPNPVQNLNSYNFIANYGSGCTANAIGLSMQDSSARGFLPQMATWCNDFNPSWGTAATPDKWNFEAVSLNGQSVTLFMDGNVVTGTLSILPTIKLSQLNIGADGSNVQGFNGMISNVQIYNKSLTVNEIDALYIEGIGGAPINLQSLVGWWPLNGNINDYSGYNQNGQVYSTDGVAFNGTWQIGYTPP
jgi:hypothetical protein